MQLVANKQEGDQLYYIYRFICYLRLTPKTSVARMLNKQRNCAELKQTYGGLL